MWAYCKRGYMGVWVVVLNWIFLVGLFWVKMGG